MVHDHESIGRSAYDKGKTAFIVPNRSLEPPDSSSSTHSPTWDELHKDIYSASHLSESWELECPACTKDHVSITCRVARDMRLTWHLRETLRVLGLPPR